MKKLILFLLVPTLTIMSCSRLDFDLEENQRQITNANFEKKFGVTIDPEQDWNSINSDEITITANANLTDIVKVQILTESPFLNKEAHVLNEADVTKDGVVTLTYSAPNYYKELVAACVNSKGVYRIQVFNVGDKEVKFASTTRTTRRATANEAPNFTTIKLKAPKKSVNTLRTESNNSKFSVWKGSKWNDRMWGIADGQTFSGGWKMDPDMNLEKGKDRGVIYRDLNGFAAGEKANVENIINSFLYKYDKKGWNGRKNNISVIRNSTNFVSNDNYVYSDGINPVTLIPIQAYTDEFKLNHIYYYYYKPEEIPAGMDEVEYIKQLPKFMAIQVERIQTSAEMKVGTLYRRQEFLLPFYKGTPVEGDNQASAIFPRGYKIGFLNQKNNPIGSYDLNHERSGCVYGDGRLNYENNHWGQYLSAMDPSLGGRQEDGMNFTDPRIAMFCANDKLYMCFEDGADCNFSDMIFEIGGGVLQLEEEIEPEAEAYTMCFEDRPLEADYDMNDVVLRATRLNESRIQLSVIACGAHDRVALGGIQGKEQWGFNGKEVHELFGLDSHSFINTANKKQHIQPVSEYVEVDKSLRIEDFLKSIYIVNLNSNRTISIAKKGEPPFAIIVPSNFQYPLEGQRITEAYLEFLNWAQSVNQSNDWYLFGESRHLYPDFFSTNQ